MADTRVQTQVEDWVRENWMRDRFGRDFSRNRVTLSAGGVFDFDAVSADRTVIASISTSGGKTASGNYAVGKLMKIRSDMLFLHMAEGAKQRMLVLTEQSMLDVCEKERLAGRTPKGIEFHLADIPSELRAKLVKARAEASKEVTPNAVAEQLPDEVIFSTKSDS